MDNQAASTFTRELLQILRLLTEAVDAYLNASVAERTAIEPQVRDYVKQAKQALRFQHRRPLA